MNKYELNENMDLEALELERDRDLTITPEEDAELTLQKRMEEADQADESFLEAIERDEE